MGQIQSYFYPSDAQNIRDPLKENYNKNPLVNPVLQAQNRVNILEDNYSLGNLDDNDYDPDNFYDLFIRNADKGWIWLQLLQNPNMTLEDIMRAIPVFGENREFIISLGFVGNNPGINWKDIKKIIREYPDIHFDGFTLARNRNISIGDIKEAIESYPQVVWTDDFHKFGDPLLLDNTIRGVNLDKLEFIFRYYPEIPYNRLVRLEGTWEQIKKFFEDYPEYINDKNYISRSENYNYLSTDPNITWDDIKEALVKYPEIKWNFRELSKNPNISWDDIKEALVKYPEIKWNFRELSKNPNITWDDIKEALVKYPEITWDGAKILENPNITWDDIKEAIKISEIKWDSYHIINSPNITVDMVIYMYDNSEIFDDVEGRLQMKDIKNITYDEIIELSDPAEVSYYSPFHIPKGGRISISSKPNIGIFDAMKLFEEGIIDQDSFVSFLYFSRNASWGDLKLYLVKYPHMIEYNMLYLDYWLSLSSSSKISVRIVNDNPSYPWDYYFLSINKFGYKKDISTKSALKQ